MIDNNIRQNEEKMLDCLTWCDRAKTKRNLLLFKIGAINSVRKQY